MPAVAPIPDDAFVAAFRAGTLTRPVTAAGEWFTVAAVPPADAAGLVFRLTVPAGGVRVVELTGG